MFARCLLSRAERRSSRCRLYRKQVDTVLSADSAASCTQHVEYEAECGDGAREAVVWIRCDGEGCSGVNLVYPSSEASMKYARLSVWSCLFVVAIAVFSIDEVGSNTDPKPVDEVKRVRAYIDRAVHFLEHNASPVQTLDARARRQQLVRMLGEYRDRGIFPHGHQESGLVLYFVDEHGTPCALASLIQGTGRSDIVDAVRAQMNTAWVHEIVDDPQLGPVLADWLKANGLTVADAATIQVPGYFGDGPGRDVAPWYGLAAVTSLSANAASATINTLTLGSPGSTSAWLGIFSGAMSVALGVSELGSNGERKTLATVSTVGGLTTFALSAVRLLTAADQPAVVVPGTRLEPDVKIGNSGRSMIGFRFKF